jgi:hypothetical protein
MRQSMVCQFDKPTAQCPTARLHQERNTTKTKINEHSQNINQLTMVGGSLEVLRARAGEAVELGWPGTPGARSIARHTRWSLHMCARACECVCVWEWMAKSPQTVRSASCKQLQEVGTRVSASVFKLSARNNSKIFKTRHAEVNMMDLCGGRVTFAIHEHSHNARWALCAFCVCIRAKILCCVLFAWPYDINFQYEWVSDSMILASSFAGLRRCSLRRNYCIGFKSLALHHFCTFVSSLPNVGMQQMTSQFCVCGHVLVCTYTIGSVCACVWDFVRPKKGIKHSGNNKL